VANTLARSHQLDQLNGAQKAAILCMVLGSESASLITQKLSPEEVEQISFEIARMDRVSSEATDAVLSEWLEVMLAADSIAAGGMEFAREVLERGFGQQKAGAMLKRIQAQISETAGLHRLRNADPQQLGNMLRGEHPQTVALILAHLEAPHTAAVLKEMDPSFGAEVVLRIARMEKVSPDMLVLIERSILTETDLGPAQSLTTSGGPAVVAEVLNLVAPSLEKAIMRSSVSFARSTSRSWHSRSRRQATKSGTSSWAPCRSGRPTRSRSRWRSLDRRGSATSNRRRRQSLQ
jgi:flagellar motor switch protein FliG